MRRNTVYMLATQAWWTAAINKKETIEKTEYTTRTKTVKPVATEDAWARSDKLTKKMQRSEEGKLTNIQAVWPSSEKGLFMGTLKVQFVPQTLCSGELLCIDLQFSSTDFHSIPQEKKIVIISEAMLIGYTL